MSPVSPEILESIDRIAREVTAPAAPKVDAESAFPEETIDALAAAGLLGVLSAREVGGLGLGPRAAAAVIERLARECGSSAMVATMHYCGTAVLEKHAPIQIRRDAASGRHLSTLAFSEAGSRSQFWAPLSTADRAGGQIQLSAKKSWVTSAHQATAYVWSSRPIQADGPSTIWLVPSDAAGLEAPPRYDGLGLRGNDSTPVTAEKVRIPETNILGEDGQGFAIMMGIVLPIFNILNASCSVGLMEGATERTAAHAGGTRHQHIGSSLADLPTIRAYIARMRIQTDMARALLSETVDAVETSREDAMLRVLECKAAAAESALMVTATGMRVCGGASYRREVGVERFFRDAQAANIMAPTTDALFDFIGKAVCGLPLF